MRSLIPVLILLLSLPCVAPAQQGFGDDLLNELAGTWVMTGTIAGDAVVHDLDASWVLDGFYLQFHEIARAVTDEGKPAYEAIVTFGWDPEHDRYVCLWLDSTGGTGLTNGILGYGKREGDSIPLVFADGADSAIHNTFQYRRESDSWRWIIENVRGEERSLFADVTLERRQAP